MQKASETSKIQTLIYELCCSFLISANLMPAFDYQEPSRPVCTGGPDEICKPAESHVANATRRRKKYLDESGNLPLRVRHSREITSLISPILPPVPAINCLGTFHTQRRRLALPRKPNPETNNPPDERPRFLLNSLPPNPRRWTSSSFREI
jgi:hypothetical protein